MDIIGIFFRGLNFFLLCSLGIYAFYRYILPMAKEQIAKKQDAIKRLKEETSMIQNEHQAITKADHNQEIHIKNLQDKIDRWGRIYNDEQATKNALIVAQKEKIMLRREKQQTHFEELNAQQILLPSVLKETTQELSSFFADLRHQQEYVSRLIAFMKAHKHP